MQVPSPDKQHAVMIEAVENHTPEVIVVDEIGTEEESRASRTIAERGVQLVATAHGYNLENLIKNPTLNDLIGGFQTVVLGDEEAKFRGTSKSVVERKGLPTFDVIIVIESRDVFRVYNPVMQYVDAFLRNDPLDPEIRKRKEDSSVSIENKPEFKELSESRVSLPEKLTRIYPYAINAEKLDSLIESMDLPVQIAHELSEADMVLTIKAKVGPKSKVKKLAKTHQVPLHIILSADIECLEKFFRSYFKLLESNEDLEQEAIREIDYACRKVMKDARYYELNPRPGYLRSIQHKIARENGLNSMSVGEDPNRRLRVYPRI
jgi:predicted RNA-binding protein Jag